MSGVADIRWIAFDAVGTLIFADPPVATVYQQIGKQHGSCMTRGEVKRRFSAVFSEHLGVADLSSSEAAEYAFWKSVVGEVLCDADDAEACFAELHAWFAKPYAWRCYADVAPALDGLHQRGYRLAMASNFDARLHTVRAGLEELTHIERCVVSSEAGWRKPHHGFFTALIEACGSEPQQILMVGNDVECDIRGAEQAGLQTRLLVRDPSLESKVNHEIAVRSLTELLDDDGKER